MGHFTNYLKRLPAMRNRTPDLILTPAGISDDFTGANDDLLDASKWTVSGSGATSIQNNTFHTIVESGTTSTLAESTWKLSGDFDIQIDYNILQTGQGFAHASFFMRLLPEEGGGNYWYINSYTTTMVDYWDTHAGGGSRGITALGRKRITRVSNVFHLYSDNNQTGSWSEFSGSPMAGSDSDQDVYLQFNSGTTTELPTLEIERDNFICNSADSILRRT